jgi:hypothetical protein
LYAYWRGATLPEQPRIEAGHDAWYWGVPLPDGRYNTLVFIDARHLRTLRPAPLADVFQRLIRASQLMAGCRDPVMEATVRAVDATPYLAHGSVTSTSIKIGEAALALDPVSSSGVQKAIQTALAGAVVANTLLRQPHAQAAAMQLYRSSLEDAAARHRVWAAAHYALVARRRSGTFWEARAVSGVRQVPQARVVPDEPPSWVSSVQLSPLLDFIEIPCIEGEFVTVKPAVRHPALDAPMAFLGNWEVAPLLRDVRPGMTPLQVARAWSNRVPAASSMAMIVWLLDRRLLVACRDGLPQTRDHHARRETFIDRHGLL